MAWLVQSQLNLRKHLIIKMPSVGKRQNISQHFQIMFVRKAKFKKFEPNMRYNEGRQVSWVPPSEV